MALVPLLDLRASAPPDITHAPSNIEAEQALLGVLLYDNGAYERLSDHLQARHFFEPFHGRLFDAIQSHIRRGQLAEPILLAEEFQRDPAFEELGGVRYLADLVDRAPPAANAADYARVTYDLALRRDLIRIGGEIAAGAQAGDPEMSGREQIEAAEQQLYTLAETGAVSSGLIGFADALSGAVEMAAEAYNRDGGLSGLATGLTDLDQKLGGLHPSDLIIVAARPSMGKTALVANIAFHVAKTYAYDVLPDGARRTVNGGVVAFFSLEMSAEQMAMRLLAEVDRGAVRQDPQGRDHRQRVRPHPRRRRRDPGLPALYRRHRRHLHGQAGGAGAAAQAHRRARPDRGRLPSAGHRHRHRAHRQPGAGGQPDHPGPQGPGQGAVGADHRRRPALAAGGKPRGQEAPARRPARIRLHRTGRRRGHVHLPRGLLPEPHRAQGGDAEHLAWQEKIDPIRNLAEIIIGKQRHGPIGVVRLHYNEDLTKFSNHAREGRFEVR